MSAAPVLISERAAGLAEAFDRTFAEMPPGVEAPSSDLLAIRLGPDRFALRLSELSGLFKDTHVTPLPGPVGSLLGIASLRGVILPVYDLRALLGISTSTPARWMVVAKERPVGLACDAFEGHFRVPSENLNTGGSALHEYVAAVVHAPEPRPVVDLGAVIRSIAQAVRLANSNLEH